jgi:hypothetical protein
MAALPHLGRPAGAEDRIGAPLLALAGGCLFGVFQTVIAQRVGLLRWSSAETGWWAAELATLTWLAATSVVLGVLVARLPGWRTPLRRSGQPTERATWSGRSADWTTWSGRLLVLGAAGLGSLLAVPFAASAAAWASMYGGGVPVWQSALHVLVGAGLGMGAAAVAQRVRVVATGIAASVVVIWPLALLSVWLDPANAPVLGHPDVGIGLSAGAGPGGSPDAAAGGGLGAGVTNGWHVVALRAGAVLIALVAGALVGGRARSLPVEIRAVAAGAGPALVAATYLLVLLLAGPSWPWSPVPSALLAAACAPTAAAVTGWLLDPHRRGAANGPPRLPQ